MLSVSVKKLKSNNGASISISLLLFLVCAVIGAVVLTAATASAGRLSDLAEMDQRYYSVSSAAELLKNQLCNKPVTIIRTQITEKKTRLTYTDGGTVTSEALDDSVNYKTKINGFDEIVSPVTTISTSNMGFLTLRAVKLLYGTNNCNTAEAMNYNFSNAESSNDCSFVITPKKDETNNYEEMTANVVWNMKSDGTIVFTISNGNDNERYTLSLTLVPEIVETEQTNVSEPVVSDSGTANIYYRTVTTTVTKTLTIKWVVGGMRKEVS